LTAAAAIHSASSGTRRTPAAFAGVLPLPSARRSSDSLHFAHKLKLPVAHLEGFLWRIEHAVDVDRIRVDAREPGFDTISWTEGRSIPTFSKLMPTKKSGAWTSSIAAMIHHASRGPATSWVRSRLANSAEMASFPGISTAIRDPQISPDCSGLQPIRGNGAARRLRVAQMPQFLSPLDNIVRQNG
jgi:hypothetical protein